MSSSNGVASQSSFATVPRRRLRRPTALTSSLFVIPKPTKHAPSSPSGSSCLVSALTWVASPSVRAVTTEDGSALAMVAITISVCLLANGPIRLPRVAHMPIPIHSWPYPRRTCTRKSQASCMVHLLDRIDPIVVCIDQPGDPRIHHRRGFWQDRRWIEVPLPRLSLIYCPSMSCPGHHNIHLQFFVGKVPCVSWKFVKVLGSALERGFALSLLRIIHLFGESGARCEPSGRPNGYPTYFGTENAKILHARLQSMQPLKTSPLQQYPKSLHQPYACADASRLTTTSSLVQR